MLKKIVGVKKNLVIVLLCAMITVAIGFMLLPNSYATKAENVPNTNVKIIGGQTITANNCLTVTFDVDGSKAPYNESYTWVARDKPGVYNFIKLNGVILSEDKAGAVFDVHQYQNTFSVQMAYPVGTTIEFVKGMGLVSSSGFTAEQNLTGDTLGASYKFTFTDVGWVMDGDKADIHITKFEGNLVSFDQFMIKSVDFACQIPEVRDFIKINDKLLEEYNGNLHSEPVKAASAAPRWIHQQDGKFNFLMDNMVAGDKVEFLKGMQLGGAFTPWNKDTTKPQMYKLAEYYSFTKQADGTWLKNSSNFGDAITIQDNIGGHVVNGDNVQLNLLTSLNMGTQPLAPEQIAKIKLNDTAINTVAVDGNKIVITTNKAILDGDIKVNIEGGFIAGGYVLNNAYQGYYFPHAKAWKTAKATAIAKTTPVEIKDIDTLAITPQWGTHSQIIFNFDMTDNTVKDFFSWKTVTDVSINTHIDLLTKLVIDDKMLCEYGNAVAGDEVYVHSRVGGYELYLKDTVFPEATTKAHTFKFVRGLVFPNGRYIAEDINLQYQDGGFSLKLNSAKVQETASVYVNKTANLAVTFQPLEASNKNMTYASSDNTIATVDNMGVVTGVKIGTATITATSVDGGFVSTCAVTVSNAIKSFDKPADKCALLNTAHNLDTTTKVTLSDGTKVDATISYTGDYDNTNYGTYTLTGTVACAGYEFEPNISNTCEVRVSIIDATTLTVAIKKAEDFIKTLNKDDYTTLSWNAVANGILEGKQMQQDILQLNFVDSADITTLTDLLNAVDESKFVLTKLISCAKLADVAVTFNDTLVLPTTVEGTYDNGSKGILTITWKTKPSTGAVGTFEATGEVSGKNGIKKDIVVKVIVGNKILSITGAPTDITVDFGNNHDLPTEVTLNMADNTTVKKAITYSGDFNKMQAGKYTLTGKIDLTGFERDSDILDTFTVVVTVGEQVVVKEKGCASACLADIIACLMALGSLCVITLISKK